MKSKTASSRTSQPGANQSGPPHQSGAPSQSGASKQFRARNSAKLRVKLDRETIVDAAIARVETHGLDELSARKLGQDLGCEAMSLYHHVGSMEQLKDLIVDRLLGSIAPAEEIGPADALAKESRAYLDLAEAHAQIFVLVATRRWKGDRAVATAMRSIGYFGALEFGTAEAVARARALGAYLNGAGLALSAWAADPDHPQLSDGAQVKADLMRGLDLLLATLTKP